MSSWDTHTHTHTHEWYTHVDVGVEELRPGVACEHVDDDHLTPLLHINQQVTQLTVVLMDQIDAVRTHFLKRHHHTACYQLHTHTHTHTRQEWWSYLRTDLKWFCHSLWFYQLAASRWLQSTDLSVLGPDWIKERERNDHKYIYKIIKLLSKIVKNIYIFI